MVFLWADFIAGLVGGGAGIIVGHPLDTIKVRLQAQSVGTVQYKGIFDCIYKTIRHESIFGFYKGMGFPLATICVQNAVIFGVYGNTLHRLSAWRNDSANKPATKSDIFVAGCVAGFVQLSIACPVELVKIRLQMQTHGRDPTLIGQHFPNYRGPIHCVNKVIKNEGPRGLFRGMLSTAARDVPACGLYFLLYELLCRELTLGGHAQPSAWALFVAGGTAGIFAWGSITPIDVIKSKLQADGVHGQRYRSVWHCIVDTYRTGGVRAFCTGLSLNTLGDFPVSAITFAVYSLALRAFGEQSRASAIK